MYICKVHAHACTYLCMHAQHMHMPEHTHLCVYTPHILMHEHTHICMHTHMHVCAHNTGILFVLKRPYLCRLASMELSTKTKVY